MEIKTVKIENPDGLNMILGHTHFIKSVEDIYEVMVNAIPMPKFGLAFCEASEKCLVRYTGTEDGLVELARKNALALSAGHTFILFMQDMFPINVLPAIKNVPEVCRVFCATANPAEAIVAETINKRYRVKFHFKTMQGHKHWTNAEAAEIVGRTRMPITSRTPSTVLQRARILPGT